MLTDVPWVPENYYSCAAKLSSPLGTVVDGVQCAICQSVVKGVEGGIKDFGCGYVVEKIGQVLCKEGDTGCIQQLQGYCSQIADLINQGRFEPLSICQHLKFCPEESAEEI